GRGRGSSVAAGAAATAPPDRRAEATGPRPVRARPFRSASASAGCAPGCAEARVPQRTPDGAVEATRPAVRWRIERDARLMGRGALHPREAHSGSLSSRLNWLRAGVLGANDGIVSTAGLVVGVAAATVDRTAIATAGVAGLVAGAVSMALGEYVSVS